MEGGNAVRGEATIDLDGETFGLRPSYEAIVALEASTGKGLLQLARESVAGMLTSGEVAQVACEFMRAWGRENDNEGAAKSNPRKVGMLVQDNGGVAAAMGKVSAVLTMAATGGYTASGEVKAAKTTGNRAAD